MLRAAFWAGLSLSSPAAPRMGLHGTTVGGQSGRSQLEGPAFDDQRQLWPVGREGRILPTRLMGRNGQVRGLPPYGMPTFRPRPSWSVLDRRSVESVGFRLKAARKVTETGIPTNAEFEAAFESVLGVIRGRIAAVESDLEAN
jgi:hypothetical protein